MQNLDKIRVLIPLEKDFKNYEGELKALYTKNQKKITDTNSFEFIRDNTWFYMFLNKDALVGAIYFFIDNEHLFLNAFSKRKNFVVNLKCLTMALTWFNCPIFAEAQNRASALTLLRVGFKRVKDNLFVYNRA